MKKKKTDYRPINCNIYDELILLVIRKKRVNLCVENEKKNEIEIKTILKDVYTKEGEEFILLENGDNIRLDKIRKIDGEIFDGYCGI